MTSISFRGAVRKRLLLLAPAVAVLVLQLLTVPQAPAAQAATPGGISFTDIETSQNHTCTQTSTSATADTTGGSYHDEEVGGSNDADGTARVTLDGAHESISRDPTTAGLPLLNANEGEAQPIPTRTPDMAVWTNREAVTGLLNSGYSYRRDQNANGAFRYTLQITPSGSTQPQVRTYYSWELNDDNRQRINDFRAAVRQMHDSTRAVQAAGTIQTTVFLVGIGVLQHEGSQASGPVGACLALFAGGVYVANRWLNWRSGRTDAINAWDNLPGRPG
jgi:hypothetical protein